MKLHGRFISVALRRERRRNAIYHAALVKVYQDIYKESPNDILFLVTDALSRASRLGVKKKP